MTTSTELTVVNPATGEILDLSGEPTDSLVELIAGAQELHRRLADFEREVGDVLLEHLDRSACWTLRVGEYEVKAPSPTAGVEAYPPDLLEGELASLIAQGIITTDAASKACHRRLTLELNVPWSADHRDLARQVKDAAGIDIAGVPVKVRSAEPKTRPVQAGINALRKIPGALDALDRAKVEQPPPSRKATVKRRETP